MQAALAAQATMLAQGAHDHPADTMPHEDVHA
jgi:hypothetical protein